MTVPRNRIVDTAFHVPDWLRAEEGPARARRLSIIYFIPGNPGLIAYYNEFLSLLAQNHGGESVIAGASLGGFEQQVTTRESRGTEMGLFYPDDYEKKVYTLKDQIHLTHRRVNRLVHHLKDEYPCTASLPFQVILMGHSVGAYIALEVVRLQHESVGEGGGEEPNMAGRHVSQKPYAIISTMLLTPTIHDISLSTSGKLATPILSNIPLFPSLVQFGASGLTSTMPTTWLQYLVARVTGMKSESAIRTTTAFLQTSRAVNQALTMARHEMLEIGGDRWTAEVWGAADAAAKHDDRWEAPKHFFLFAKEDQWVADSTRQAIIQAMDGRAKIVVDEDGSMKLVHAWCLEQSELVAGIVNEWIEVVLGVQRVFVANRPTSTSTIDVSGMFGAL